MKMHISKSSLFHVIEEMTDIIPAEHVFFEEIEGLKEKLITNSFNLAVLGQFKRGKTSLINALLGEILLPTAVVPLTSILTMLRYGEKPSCKVIFSDKTEKDIPFAEIENFATEKGNPKNEKGVILVEIFFPNQYLKQGIILIDTPGIGSSLLHNNEVTYNYLQNIDAAIFLLTADQPISQAELSFLKDIQDHSQKLFFVLNKIDYLSEKQLNEIIAFNQETLNKELGEQVKLYPLSAKWALEAKTSNNQDLANKSKITAFEKALYVFLKKKKDKVLQHSLRNKLLALTNKMLSYLELEKKGLMMPVANIEEKLAVFRESAETIRKEIEDAEPIIKAEIKRILEFVDEDFKEFKEKNEKVLLKEMEKKYKGMTKFKKDALVTEFVRQYRYILEEIFEPARLKEEKKVREQYEKVTKRFSKKTVQVIEKITKTSSELFGVDIPFVKIKDEFTLEKGVPYRADPLFFSFADQLTYLLPDFIFRKILWKEVKENISHHLDMNCGRVRSDFLFQLNESSIQYLHTLHEKVESSLAYIETAVEKGMLEAGKSKKEICLLLRDIDKKKHGLKLIIRKLEA